MKAVELAVNSVDPKNGSGNLLTSFTFGSFISEDGEMLIPECCIIVGVQLDHQAQTFFCIINPDGEEYFIFQQNEVELVITTVDGIKIEMVYFGKIQLEGVSFAIFTPLNSKNPSIDLKIDGSMFSITNPQDVINAIWNKLRITPIEKMQFPDGDELLTYIPNPDFTDFPAQNLFIEHLKCIDTVLKL